MESIKAQDFWRSLETYMEALGIFDQHDLFDEVPNQPPVPQMGAEPQAAVTSH